MLELLGIGALILYLVYRHRIDQLAEMELVRQRRRSEYDELRAAMEDVCVAYFLERDEQFAEVTWNHRVDFTDMTSSSDFSREPGHSEADEYELARTSDGTWMRRLRGDSMNVEWDRVPHHLVPWIETSFERCVWFFRERPGIYPGVRDAAYMNEQLDRDRVWTPPKHASDDDIARSYERLLATRAAMCARCQSKLEVGARFCPACGRGVASA